MKGYDAGQLTWSAWLSWTHTHTLKTQTLACFLGPQTYCSLGVCLRVHIHSWSHRTPRWSISCFMGLSWRSRIPSGMTNLKVTKLQTFTQNVWVKYYFILNIFGWNETFQRGAAERKLFHEQISFSIVTPQVSRMRLKLASLYNKGSNWKNRMLQSQEEMNRGRLSCCLPWDFSISGHFNKKWHGDTVVYGCWPILQALQTVCNVCTCTDAEVFALFSLYPLQIPDYRRNLKRPSS